MWQPEDSDTDEEISDSTPILTPSSSCASLNSLCENLPASPRDCTPPTHSHELSALIKTHKVNTRLPGDWLDSENERPLIEQVAKDAPSNNETSILGLAPTIESSPKITPIPQSLLLPAPETRSISYNFRSGKTTITTTVPWNPEAEIKAANLRCMKYNRKYTKRIQRAELVYPAIKLDLPFVRSRKGEEKKAESGRWSWWEFLLRRREEWVLKT